MNELKLLINRILEDYYLSHPTDARLLGLHEFDGLIADNSQNGLAARLDHVTAQLSQLEAIPDRGISADDLFDRDLVAAQLRFEIFQIGELHERSRNPMIWADDIDLSGYLLRSYAPIEQRVAAMKQQASAVPDVLKQAAEVLNARLSRPVLQTAIDVFDGVATFLRDDVPAALIESGTTESVEVEFAPALVAIDAFVADLKRREVQATDEFAIGSHLLHELVSLGELVDIPLETLLRLGEEDLERNLALARTTAASIDPNLDVAAVMRSLASDHPRAEQLISEVSNLLESLRQFTVEHAIVSIPTESRCEVRETPGFLRWAFAMMDTAGPYEDESVESFYFVTPPEDDWADERREEWLSNFDRSALPGISIHEAYPGHFVHFLHLRNVESPVRRVALSYSFIEGWAHYVEEMMLEEGYGGGDPKLRLAQLREALLRNCRLVASIKMHAFGQSVDEATQTFKTQAFLEDGPARQEAIRGTFDPGYLNYTLGKLLMRKLRTDVKRIEGTDFSLQAFHDRLLSLGAPPFALARRVLTPGESALLDS